MNSYQHLQVVERRAIAQLLKHRTSLREIARVIGRSPSTISREIKRNSSIIGNYRYWDAEDSAVQRRHTSRLKVGSVLAAFLAEQLQNGFSPDQIVMRNKRLQLSTQTIYNFVWRDYAQQGTLWKHLRYCGKGHRVRYYRRGPGKARLSRHNELSINLRPPHIGNRSRYGHWEADLVEGRGHKRPLLVLIERKSRYVLAGFLKGKYSCEVAKMAQHLLKGFKVHSVTCDNGPEFMDHQLIKDSLNCELFYAQPYKSWQKGAVENVNKLIREFFPKGTSFTHLSAFLPRQATEQINSRPRRTLKAKAPDSLLKHLTLNP